MKIIKTVLVSFVLVIALLLSLLPIGVVADDIGDPSLSGMTTFVFSGNSVTVTNGKDTNYEVVVYDTTDTETAATATTSNNSTTYSIPDGASGELKVAIKKSGGSYVFKGNGYGNITVKKAATENAYIYLNGLSLTSSFTSVITVNKDSAAHCIIHVMGGTVNTLSDSAKNNADTYTDNLAAENAVIKCKAGSYVRLIGNGTLNVNAVAKNGIKANHSLAVGGDLTLNITAKDDGISGENNIYINSGTVNITSEGGDGIKCGADDSATGDVTVNGGKITIDAYGDGIQATANLTVNAGILDITCYDGYTSSYNSSNTSLPSAKGLKAGGSYLNASSVETDATECFLTINGGYITINSADDAIHSDKEVKITAGVIDIYTSQSSGDGIHADYTNTIGVSGAKNTDLYITIHKCYEGIEGANIYIHSGIINVFASDDSINAANSDLGSSQPGGGGGSSYTFTVDITGGFVYCASSSGDCLDSNKNFTISGGTLVVLGSITSGDNTAVDTDGSFNIQGGQILTIGNAGMLVNPTTTQNYCSWTSTGTATASTGGSSSGGGSQRPGPINRPGSGGSSSGGGSVVSNNKQLTITDGSGNTLISVLVKWDNNPSGSAGYVLYSDEKLVSGSSYTLSVGNAQTITGGSNITSPSVASQPTTPDSDETNAYYPPNPNYSPTEESSTPESSQESSIVSSVPDPISSVVPVPSSTPDESDTDDLIYGDVNGNGSVEASDALLTLQHSVRRITLEGDAFIVADVTEQYGVVTSSDALCILQYSVEIIDIFDVQKK